MKLLNLIFLLVISTVVFAQQSPQFTQFSENRYVINPAITGEDEFMNGAIGYRKQWVGFGEEPTTFYVGAHQGFRKEIPQEHQPLALRTSHPEDFSFEQKEAEMSKLKHGLGGYIMSDNYGKFKKTSINASYALHLGLTDKINVSFGANAGFNNLKFDDNNILETENDPTYDRFVSENLSKSMVDLNIGTYLYSDKFFIGYATNQLAGDKISFGGSTSILDLHHNIMAGYSYKVNEDFKVTPSIYLKAVGGAPISYDLNLRGDYKNFFGGVTYRNEDATAIMAGIVLEEMIRLSYSYDINTSVLSEYNSGGHEVVLGFMLK